MTGARGVAAQGALDLAGLRLIEQQPRAHIVMDHVAGSAGQRLEPLLKQKGLCFRGTHTGQLDTAVTADLGAVCP